MKLARALADGRLAQAQGDSKAAIASFEEAAALQDGLPYTEPPFWYYPVRQTLAAALLQAGRLDEAEAQFKRALERAPNNGWSYYGLAKVYATLGNADGRKTGRGEPGQDLDRQPLLAAGLEALTRVIRCDSKLRLFRNHAPAMTRARSRQRAVNQGHRL